MANYCRAVIKSPCGTTRHNTAAAPRPLPQLPNDLTRTPTVFVRWDGHVPPLQPLYDDTCAVICPSLHHFTLRIGDKEDKVSTLRLKPCSDPTAPPAQPRVRGRPPAAVRSGISHRQGPRWPAGNTSPHSNQQNRAGNRFPLARHQGFLHAQPPFSTLPPLGRPATAKRRPD
jgi:hypothetical protein